jgi:hypothetical protein
MIAPGTNGYRFMQKSFLTHSNHQNLAAEYSQATQLNMPLENKSSSASFLHFNHVKLIIVASMTLEILVRNWEKREKKIITLIAASI